MTIPSIDSDPEAGRVDPLATLDVIQRLVLDDEARRCLLVEPSSCMFWALGVLLPRCPAAIRVFPGHGSMGQANGGVVGVVLATGRPAVVLTGDLSLHCIDAIHTGVANGCAFLTIVLQDERQTLPQLGSKAGGCRAAWASTFLPQTDFVGYARSLGGDGVRVTQAEQLEPAIRTGLASDRPFVVDVLTRRDVLPPVGGRIAHVVDPPATPPHSDAKAA